MDSTLVKSKQLVSDRAQPVSAASRCTAFHQLALDLIEREAHIILHVTQLVVSAVTDLLDHSTGMLMIHNNGPVQMKTTKVKGPPPVPPRPNQSVVNEALAKTRKAVAESRANNVTKSNIPKELPKRSIKAKTLERTCSLERPSASPKQNGLARVKSFIRDVISSDRSSSSDERRSTGPNSRRSSSDSSSIPGPISIKKSNESLNFKSVKSCKQILVRSLSASNKLDADPSKGKVSKSSSFAEKTIPIRKAPPPPLSPKPKLRPLRPLPIRQHSLSDKGSPKHSPELTPYVLPIDVQKPPTPVNDAPYASVEDFKDRLPTKPEFENNNHEQDKHEVECKPNSDTDNENNNSLERKTSRVTEMLISEIIASRKHKDDTNAVIDKGKVEDDTSSFEYNLEPIKKDMSNHEMLIYELQTMRSQSNVPESLDSKELVDIDKCESESSEPNYALSSESSGSTDEGSDRAYAYILDDDLKSR